jgi:hypothetical protein
LKATFDLTGLLPHQRAFVLDDREGWTTGLVSGYGQGKSVALALRALLLSLRYPGTTGALVSPTFRMGRDILRPLVEGEAARRAPWLRLRWVAQDSLWTLPDVGSTILLRSGDDAGRLVGLNADWVGLDEAALIDDAALRTALSRARVGPRMGFAVSTPEGRSGAFYQIFGRGPDPARAIDVIRGACWPRGSQAPVNTIRFFGHRRELLAAYLMGEFVSMHEGRVYPGFDAGKAVAPQALDPDADLLAALDFNVSPACWVVAQERRGRFLVLDEVRESGAGSTELAARAFVARFPPEVVRSRRVVLYGDASGRARSTAALGSDWDVVRDVLGAAGWEVVLRVPAGNPPVIDRVNAVDRALAVGEVLLDPKCRGLVESFERTAWKPGTRTIDKPAGETWTHAADALGYLIAFERPVRGRAVVATNAAPAASPTAPAGFRWSKPRAAAGW